ncbi:hypothetical protein GCM10027048_34880 [Hymenobacter coalescens]
MKKISTVAVITDDEFFRDASTYFLAQQNYAVLDIGQEEHEIRAQLLHQRPDLVILRTGRVSAQGACALQCIYEHNLPTKTVAYTDAGEAPTALHAYLTRADGLEALLRCVAVLEGGHAASAAPAHPAPATTAPDPLAVLSAQERKVLALIGRGLSSGQMAEQLFVSTHTIKNHKTNITRKLAMASGRDLLTVALALRDHPALLSAL